MKDRADADRQTATVAALLDRFFNSDPERRWELQLVADEVGMGKTFVALGAAYSILASMATGVPEADLIGCARRVLVIAPHNTALARKWQREVREFVSRCIPAELAPEAEAWFLPRYVDRLDELAQVLRDDSFCGVIVTHMGVLAGGKLQHYDLKRRFLLGVLFRFWGVRFQRDARARLLKGAPDGWPSQPDELTRLEDDERKRLPFRSEEQVLAAVRSVAATEAGASELEELLAVCKEIAEPYTRERGERFERVEKKLVELYRNVSFAAVDGALPLVIVDEAHNWKNGPKKNANGYGNFKRFLGPLTRRALLLTATPFQLRPQEVLELLRVGSVITPSPDPSISEQRRARLDRHRDEVIAPVLENAARQSRYVARAWARVPIRAAHALEATWISPDLIRARDDLRALAHQEGVVSGELVNKSIEAALIGSDPDVRELLRESLRLYAYNHDLSQELGAFVIRHRRRAEHRLVRVGDEFSNPPPATVLRTDRHVLHASPGIDVRGVGELPHYLLMRCVSEMKGGKGRTSLGSALTGCYSTLLESAEGKSLRSKLQDGSAGKVYLDLLVGMVSAEQDSEHPKLKAVVDSVLETWRSGEKALLFCFRTHTAQRLHTILSDRIKRELETKREAALGSPEALTRLRARFTRRDGDLVVLGLDRVLWSLRWAAASERVALPDLTADDLRLSDPELDRLAELAIKYGVDLRSEQVDRVFLNRATEHVLALRLRSRSHLGGQLFTRVLGAMADETWIHFAYGIDLAADENESGEVHGDLAGLDERGVHAVFIATAQPQQGDVEVLGAEIRERRERARRQGQVSIFDVYADGPSFWLGREPEPALRAPETRTLVALHAHLLTLTREGSGFDWRERLMVLQALRRALMRESLLVRLLPERSERDEQSWGELLVDHFFAPLPGQHESVADRITVFVEDLQAAAGNVYEPGSPRQAMYEATRMRETGFAVLVDGSTGPERRERVFAGFNSPLLPEVLICTSVGQEGIDLHRHCRNVIHYDLAWNPAVLEQRTGRVDRIGSKTFRERQAATIVDAGSYLNVGVPFLAGTYDERMFEEIRVRAQTFEVLTGGDVATDNLEGNEDEDGAEGNEEGLAFPPLPSALVADLRVRLHIWEPPS